MENGRTHLSDETFKEVSKILAVPKEKLFEEESDLMPSVNGGITNLLNELSENKKLLRQVELNQEKLQKQLNKFLSKLIEK